MNQTTPDTDLLIVIQSPPSLDLEPLELGMACAAFEQNVAFVFSGAGLEWLIAGQQPRRPKGKSADKLIHALAMYDCDQVFYLANSSEQPATGFVNNVSAISAADLDKLIAHSKHQLNF